MTAPTALFSTDEIKLISACLLAAETGPFFPAWEFQTLFGVTRSELAAVRSRWPDVSFDDESVYLSVMNSVGNLLGYPHGKEDALRTYSSEGLSKIRHLRDRLASLKLG
jgi:hypothetical protein